MFEPPNALHSQPLTPSQPPLHSGAHAWPEALQPVPSMHHRRPSFSSDYYAQPAHACPARYSHFLEGWPQAGCWQRDIGCDSAVESTNMHGSVAGKPAGGHAWQVRSRGGSA